MATQKIGKILGTAVVIIIVVILSLSLVGSVAHAAGLVDDTIHAGNAYSKYALGNYQLDFYVDNSWDWLPWNWTDGLGKSVMYGLYAITNFIWTVSLYISNATGYVIQEAYKLDFISDTVNAVGKNMQTLAGVSPNGFSTEGFYVGFLLILILIIGIYVAYTGLIKRETTKAIHAVINFLVVFLLSASFIAYAPDYIGKINEFSSDVSNAALTLGTKIVMPNTENKGRDSVDMIRDSLFSIQVKQPWLLLQFGDSNIDNIGADRVESLLAVSPEANNGEDRETKVKAEIEERNNTNLTITKTMNRLGTVTFLFIFNIGISIFVFLLTGIMIFSQVLFIIFAMFLPISLLLSMIPTYESMGKRAIAKLFNTIMMRAGITLIITVAFSISTMFYSLSAGYPFFMTAFLQIVTFAGIYMKLGDLMSMFSLQANDSQQMSRRMLRRPLMFFNRGARRMERRIGRTLTAGMAGSAAGRHDTKAKNHTKTAQAADGRSNHAEGKYTKENDTQTDRTKVKDAKVKNTSNVGGHAGRKIGIVIDTKNHVVDNENLVKDQVKNIPIQAQYTASSGVNQVKENISGFKRSVVEERICHQQGNVDKQDQRRQSVAQKRKQMEQVVRERKETKPIVSEAVKKGTALVQKRAATVKPVTHTTESEIIQTPSKGKKQKAVKRPNMKPSKFAYGKTDKRPTPLRREPIHKIADKPPIIKRQRVERKAIVQQQSANKLYTTNKKPLSSKKGRKK